MSLRHCPRCRTEVEDVGGYCLLGHPLRLAAPTDSLATLRAEVDKAFADVEIKVAEVLAGPPATPAAPAVGPQASPPPPPRPKVAEFEPSTGADPIVDFAPAPTMDWGPERVGLLRRFG